MAYLVGLKPREFWESTPGELWAMVAAQRARDEVELRRAALLAQMISATVWAQNAPTIEDLLGWNTIEASEDETDAFLEVWHALNFHQGTGTVAH